MGAGAASALSTAPFGLWPVLFLTFPLLVLLLDGRPGKGWRAAWGAACDGWWFGFGYFLASLWWIGSAFLVEADVFGWLLPFAVVALPAGLAIFTGFGLALARLLWSNGPTRIFALATGLVAGEWLRGHVLTGFPWNSFGYALAENLALSQTAAFVGLWGLTLIAVPIFASPALLLDPAPPSRRALWPAAAAAVLLCLYGAGMLRLRQEIGNVADVHLRIMQPALPQDRKFAYGERHRILDDYLALSGQPSTAYPRGLDDVTLLIWPESAFPFIYDLEPWAPARIAAALPDNVTLVTGAARSGRPPSGQTSSIFNSIRVIDGDGVVRQSVDKVHLVPFGEYLPFQETLEALGLEQLTRQRGGFAAGTHHVPLDLPGAPSAAPLICYEAIFPHSVIPEGPRPGFLLNVTNDAWFGLTPGPYQHFLQARLRAIEEGLPLVRAANTGISAVVDPLGRIVAALNLGEKGNLDAGLPRGLDTPPPAGRYGATPFAGLYFTTLLLAVLGRRATRTPENTLKS
ncbi:apolipoprotein N-acyltransferase [Aquabacter spiritensis]|uniref:Apolipoprotein N-acyltransferase n=2 Tax=Aquabacter spiritensis TaxID=933073 RepID=A0A4R3M4E9_9HYPH|nr:apolipoprotein N-acyltransferase [Aquabacter spiritensis]TCT06247.1 apolipoprotein N-acyltransferase [Aquabacter spiritensis]